MEIERRGIITSPAAATASAEAFSIPDAPAPPGKPLRIAHWCKLAIALLFLYQLTYHYHHQTRGHGQPLGDFPTFHLAAEYALQHRDIYTAETSPGMIYVYPPLIAFLFTPLTLISLRHAAQVALVLNALMLFGSVILGTRAALARLGALSPQRLWPASLIVCLLSITQIQSVLTMGETDALMLFMFTLGLYWLDELPGLAGITLALALNIKYLSVVTLPYLILRRRWKAVTAFVLGSVFFALIPSLLLGWRENLRCLRVALGGLLLWIGIPPSVSHAIKIHDIGDDLSVSVTSALARLLRSHGLSNSAALGLAAAVGVAALLVVMAMYHSNGFKLWFWPRSQGLMPYRGLVALEWAGLVTVALPFSPDTNTRHLVLAVLVNAMAAAVLVTAHPKQRNTALFGAAIILLAFLMPFGRTPTARKFYYGCSIPGWGLLAGYLIILRAGLEMLRGFRGEKAFGGMSS